MSFRSAELVFCTWLATAVTVSTTACSAYPAVSGLLCFLRGNRRTAWATVAAIKVDALVLVALEAMSYTRGINNVCAIREKRIFDSWIWDPWHVSVARHDIWVAHVLSSPAMIGAWHDWIYAGTKVAPAHLWVYARIRDKINAGTGHTHVTPKLNMIISRDKRIWQTNSSTKYAMK
jgi:hypothetical protein